MNSQTPSTNVIRLGLPMLAAAALTSVASAQINFGPASNVIMGTQPSGAVAADLNGDGHADLATTVDGPDRISIQLNDGSGNFAAAPASFLPNSSSPQDLAAGDLDGDGDMDLAVAIRDPQGSVLIMTNNGAGSFTLSNTVIVGDRPRGISLGDIDADGDLDIAVANRDDGTASVITNNGASWSATTIAIGGETRDTVFGDFDNDKDLDLAVTEHDGRAVHTFTNMGGSFSPSSVLSVGPLVRPDGLTAADLNADGMLDIAVAVSDGTLGINQASLFTGTGTGFAGPVGFDTGGTNTSDIIADDFDCDGAIDLVTSNQGSNNISALRNTGGGLFGAPTVSAVGTNPDSLATADLDNDGDADLAVAARDSNAISVLDNESCSPVEPCAGDANGDGLVNVNDLNMVIVFWGTTNADADVDGSGTVEVNDLVMVISNWGACL